MTGSHENTETTSTAAVTAPDLAAVGARIRAARIAAGLSQVALGKALRVNHRQIRRWESGQIADLSGLGHVAALLGVGEDQLAGRGGGAGER